MFPEVEHSVANKSVMVVLSDWSETLKVMGTNSHVFMDTKHLTPCLLSESAIRYLLVQIWVCFIDFSSDFYSVNVHSAYTPGNVLL